MATGPQYSWKTEWRLGVDTRFESKIGEEIIEVFSAFWRDEGIGERSKSTRQRYEGALHALGGYLVQKAVEREESQRSGREMVRSAVEADEGPLIHLDNLSWQQELDTVCRRLNKYLQKNR
jgi:hypothetical protein